MRKLIKILALLLIILSAVCFFMSGLFFSQSHDLVAVCSMNRMLNESGKGSRVCNRL
jgi:uncharacterized membrane protein YuzA (DUF378 family)